MTSKTLEQQPTAVCNVNDISLSRSDALHLALDAMDEAVTVLDAQGLIVYLNQAAITLIDRSPFDACGTHWSEVIVLLDETTRKPLRHNPLHQALSENRFALPSPSAHATAILAQANGQHISVEYRISAMHGENNMLCGAVLTLHDISHTQQLVSTLLYQATHDALTRLVNRREFEQRLSRVLDNTSRHKTHAMLMMDLDGFKIVNDNFGHAAGDEVLRQVAKVLASAVRERDTLARLGGDEFALLLEHCSSAQALKTATHIKHAISQHNFRWHDQVFHLDISIGVTPLARDKLKLTDIMDAADCACYVSKKSARGPVLSE